jgi:hypothetical protein
MRPHLPSADVTSRPNWMLLAMALPVGMLLDRLTGGWDNLSSSILILMGWLHNPTLLQRHTAGMVSHLVVPALLAFIVLKATRLGAWLAPNRLALGCLLVANAVVVALALRGLFLAAIDEPPFVSGTLSAVATPIVVASLAAGLAALLGSTVWHRLVRDKSKVVLWCKSLLREV